MARKFLYFLWIVFMVVSICLPLNNAHLLKAEASEYNYTNFNSFGSFSHYSGSVRISNGKLYVNSLIASPNYVLYSPCSAAIDSTKGTIILNYYQTYIQGNSNYLCASGTIVLDQSWVGNTIYGFIFNGTTNIGDGFSGTLRPSSGNIVITADMVNKIPSVSLTTPTTNQSFSAVDGHNTITYSGRVYDPDGDRVDVSVTMGGVTKTVSVNPAPTTDPGVDNWSVVFSMPADNVPEGLYNSSNVTIQAIDKDPATGADKGGTATANLGASLVVDKTPPDVNDPAVTVDSATQITVQAAATDKPDANNAGLDAQPFIYNRNLADIGTWQDGNLLDTELIPNTQYTYKIKARDSVGNESFYSNGVSKYTLALDPSGILATAKTSDAITFAITGSPGQGSQPEYKVEIKEISTGNVVATSDFSTELERSMSGLTQGIDYEVWVTTRNGDQVENASVKMIDSIKTNSPPTVTLDSPINGQIFSEVSGREQILVTGTATDPDGDDVTVTASIGAVIKPLQIVHSGDTFSFTFDVVSDGIPEGNLIVTVTADDGK